MMCGQNKQKNKTKQQQKNKKNPTVHVDEVSLLLSLDFNKVNFDLLLMKGMLPSQYLSDTGQLCESTSFTL